MRNKLAILTLLILFIVSISCVSAEDSNSVSVLSDSNSDVYVSPTGNDNNVGDVNNPFATINKAIDSNVSNIHLSEGKFIGTGNNGLTIENKSITIIGAGADKTIIDLNKTQFMDIKSTSSVVLTNLTIINGYTKYGGAIYNNGNLTIQNCNFKNNSATSGGAIYSGTTANLNIYSSTFEDNVVTNNGGAVFSYSYVGIYDSTFLRNKGTGTYSTGGSIYINGNSNKYSVLNRNIFKDTSVARQGGALYLSYVNVTNCIFENASTTDTGSSNGGGAIYGSSFNLKNNTMTNCVSKSGNGNYIFAFSGFNGVVTILEGKTADVTSSTFTLNATATDDMGHPIHGGSYTFYLDDIRIGSASSVNGFITGTFSKLLDDGKYIVTVSGPLNNNAIVKTTTANVKIDRDYVDYYVSPNGDDDNNDGSKDKPFKTINKAITEAFAKNIYVNIYLLEGTYSGTGNVNLELTKLLGYLNIIGVDGKTIIDGNGKDYAFNFGTTLNVNIKNIIFTNLYSKKYAGLIKGGSGDFTVNIDNCTFEKCNAKTLIQINGKVNDVIMRENVVSSSFITNVISINNLLFENNSGNGHISAEKGIYNSTFINNKITAKSTNDYGIIYVSDANFVSSNNVFENNTVKGLYINRGSANFTSINDTFVNNDGVSGGAVKGGGTFINAKFINNKATKGGAIYHDSNVLTLKDCIFENNKADDGDDIYGYIAPNGITGGLCLNMSNTLTLVSTNSSSIRSELKAIFDLDGLKVSGYNIKFYLNGVYKGSAPLVNGVATFVAVANDGKYEISASGDYINKTTVVKGVLNVDANPVSVFDVYVSGTGSDESGDGSLAKPFATIKKAFEYGMSQNTLSLTIHIIGTLKGEGNVNLDLAPLIDLTIVGENKETSIIDAEKNKYIFDFTPAYDNVKVYLKNLTIKNGVTTTYPTQGGGKTVDVGLVRIDGYYLSVDDCVFRNTTGHGISADKLFSTLIVNNTKFIESSGGVYSATKALNVIVANTEFINCNLGVNKNGRTVYLTGLIAVSDIFISSSSIPRYNVTQVLLDNVTFDGNYNGTKTVGSALYLEGTNATVINSKFINLKDISAIHAFSSSGYKCNVTIMGTYFENNTRDIDYGYGQTNDYRPIFWLINSTFINSGAFACPDMRYRDAWWVVNNTKFINMTNQVLFRGSISSTHKDDSLPDGVNNIITIINSLFLNNERGVQFIGGNVTGSSFYNTEVTASGTAYIVYLDNNFWNSSEPTYVYSPSISCGSWIVPVLVGDNASGPVQVIRLVYMAFNGTDYSYYDVSKVPILDVNASLTVSNGVITPNKGVLNSNGLTANYTYNGVGNQTVTATLSDGNILKLNVTFYRIDTFTNMTISNNAPQTGDYITVNVVVRDKNGKLLNGSVNVYLNSVLKGTISLINGMGSFDVLAEKTGPCEIFVNYTGDLDNSYSSNMTIVSVKNTQMNVSVSDSDSASNVTFTVDFDHVANGFVFVTIGGVTYNATVSGKEAKVIVPPLAVGKYDAIVSYNGVVNKTVAVNISPDRNPVLNISDIVMIYKDGTRMVAVLTDYLGNPIANAIVYFTINGKTYNKTTDANGTASMGLNLASNVYKATVSYNGSDKYNAVSKNITVTINPTIISKDLVKMYQNATRFYAKFTDSTGKAIANKEIRFNINGVFYTKKTDKDGVADLGIMLRPGNYILTAYNPVTGEEKGFNITVKSLIMQNDLTKYYLNASRFEATVYNKDGSLAVNKEVTFNINGVFYHKKTDENGVASLGIALRPGEYTITTMYDGLDIGNKVTVMPTLVTKDLSMKYLDGSNFTALTLDGQGKPLANQNVSFNVNGVFYHKVTNKDGIASLGIRLMSGEYIITSYWNDFQTGNTIKISP
ncbi:adhesin [Methanobrevibacter sp. TLL-48-HuF1]|uniref:right-handed parallel beta-helix repeat-containing protein n=1 Tax=Methanobrevibacter sp. TLL-48-HuF1 TaxID=2870563 RepID=UPI002026DFBF|nr:right-handed parallel beta-helix repeat-containing protein [Methanobrevibacter sp. TLL-48-HuF1]URN49371.1 adhesin [Methanobrevibacter sp. TLL-48-HuF1]